MTRRIRLLAPAKINWTLEVLRIRPDGYHEIRSVLQTVGLCDIVTLTECNRLELSLTGDAGHLVDEAPEQNLAWRAAKALGRRAGIGDGVRIEIEKHIPVAAGLGGGSSDAAAVLRGCNLLWGAGQDQARLIELAGEIGSDPPFFIVGGTASVSGRGEMVRALPDADVGDVILATPVEHHRGEKTAQMYAALEPRQFSDGDAAMAIEEVVLSGRRIDEAELTNAFEHVLGSMQPATDRAMRALRDQGRSPHLAGSGPSFYLLVDDHAETDAVRRRLSELGFTSHVVRAMSRDESLRIEER